MAKIKVSGETPFQVATSRFCIGQTSEGYTLNYSTDGVNWTAWTDGTLAEVDQVVVDAPQGLYFKLAGNVDDNVPVVF